MFLRPVDPRITPDKTVWENYTIYADDRFYAFFGTGRRTAGFDGVQQFVVSLQERPPLPHALRRHPRAEILPEGIHKFRLPAVKLDDLLDRPDAAECAVEDVFLDSARERFVAQPGEPGRKIRFRRAPRRRGAENDEDEQNDHCD